MKANLYVCMNKNGVVATDDETWRVMLFATHDVAQRWVDARPPRLQKLYCWRVEETELIITVP